MGKGNAAATARRVAIVLIAGLFLVVTPSTAMDVPWRRTQASTNNVRGRRLPNTLGMFPSDRTETGTVRPADSNIEHEGVDDVAPIGGPQTKVPALKISPPPPPESSPPLQLPPPEPTAAPTTLPLQNSTATPSISQIPKTSSPLPSTSPKPPPTSSSMPKSTPKKTPQAFSPSPSSSSHSSTRLPTSTTARVVSQLPTQTAAQNASGPPTQTPRITLPPQPQSPQAVEILPERHVKNWPLIVAVAGITGAAAVVAVLLWRDTKRSRSDEGDSVPHQTASGDIDCDWYASSPNLSLNDGSVDTFMGRQPTLAQSDQHVSSRADSTADLLNVSTVGDRSTGSDGSSRSQSIPESTDEASTSHRLMYADATQAAERMGSTPRVSFDDEVNVLSDWSGSDMDASVQAIFNAHYHTSVASPATTTEYAAAGSATFSPTSTDSSDRSNSSVDDECDDSSSDEDDQAFTLMPRRYSNGSAYSAVPLHASSDLHAVFASSAWSGWSDFTVGASECGSPRSVATQDDEEL